MKKLFIIARLFLFIFVFQSLAVFAQSEATAKKYRLIQSKPIKNFVKELNELGKLGYKLKLIERNSEVSPPEFRDAIEIMGIVELKEGDTFEYEWFQSLTLDDFVEQVSPKAEIGFYFSNRIGYSIRKNPYEGLPEPKAEKGTTKRDEEELKKNVELIKRLTSQEPVDLSLFILERKNKIIRSISFKFATAIPTTSIFGTSVIEVNKIEETLAKSMSEINTEDYFPVAMFFSSKVFKTRVSRLPTVLFQNKTEDKIVENSFDKVGADEEKKTQGGKRLSINEKLALAAKKDGKGAYFWLEPQKKDFLTTISKISDAGARYSPSQTRLTSDGIIFEKPLIDDGKRFEYKVVSSRQTPSKYGTSDSSIYEFNDLINQGFQPRALFYNDGMNILFEKLKN